MPAIDMAAYMADRRRTNRRKALKFLGGVCAICGTSESLQFDHLDPTTKSRGIADMLGNSWNSLVVELRKCQLLCYPHHLEKTLSNGDNRSLGHRKILNPQHGTGMLYTRPHSCRCEPCRDWKRKYRSGLIDFQGRSC